jgi:hypothetical protein
VRAELRHGYLMLFTRWVGLTVVSDNGFRFLFWLWPTGFQICWRWKMIQYIDPSQLYDAVQLVWMPRGALSGETFGVRGWHRERRVP